MKRIFLSILFTMIVLAAKAEDYQYLTFELVDDQKVSEPSSELVITFTDGKLNAGDQTFEIVNLKKMYFTSVNVTTDIKDSLSDNMDEATEVYDLNGRRVAKSEMRKGVYIIKCKDETYKMTVR